jgi:hypothetical protein
MQSILCGSADLFSVVELEQQLFKFTVLDRQVGPRVYALKSFACSTFKVFFHLWNENGLARARISSTMDSGLRFEWVPAKKKKSVSSYVAAVSQGGHSPIPNRCSRGSILDPCQILIFSPINRRALRLHAPITAGVSFLVLQSIQIRLGRMGLLSFQVPMQCHWETGLQSPQLENPHCSPVVLVVCLIFTLGPIVVRAQGVLPVFGWDM